MRPGRRNGQAMVEFAFVFPIFLAFIFGGLGVFLWQIYDISAQFVAQEGAQVQVAPGSRISTAESQALAAIPKSLLMNTPSDAYTYAGTNCGSVSEPSGPSPNILYICAQDTGSYGITVTVKGWKPSPFPLPFVGNAFPIYAQVVETDQWFQP